MYNIIKLTLFISIYFNISIGLLNATYKIIETNNFKIVYHSEQQNLANYYSANIENWANEVFVLHAFTPNKSIPIYVFLDDSTNTVNSFAYINNIFMFPSAITNFDESGVDWIEKVFKHELTHSVVNLYNRNAFIAYSFAIIRNNLTIPRWFFEGTAIVSETLLNNYTLNSKSIGGRGFSEKNFSKERHLIHQNNLELPRQSLSDPYLYGSSLFMFYINTYGIDAYKKSFINYNNNFFTPFFNSPISIFAETVGLSKSDLYNKWNDYLQKKYSNTSIENKDFFIQENYHSFHILKILNVDSSNNIIFYGYKKSIITGNYYTGVFSYNINLKTYSLLANISANMGSDLSPFIFYNHDSSIYFAKGMVNQFSGSNYSYIFEYDPIKPKKITKHNTINAVKTSKGLVSLVRKDYNMALLLNEEVLIDYNENYVINNITYNLKNNTLYFESGIYGSADIYITSLNLNTKELKKIVKGYNPNIFNNKLYYSYAGYNEENRYNIFEMNLENNSIKQITNTSYGAFNPVVNELGLFYLTYNYDNGLHGSLKSIAFLATENWESIEKLPEESNIKNNSSPYTANNTSTIVSKNINFFDYKLNSISALSVSSDNQKPLLVEAILSLEALNKNILLDLGLQSFDYYTVNQKYKDENNFYLNFKYNEQTIMINGFQNIAPLVNFSLYLNSKNLNYYNLQINPLINNAVGYIPSTQASFSFDNYNDYSAGINFNFENNPISFKYLFQTSYGQSSRYHFLSSSIGLLHVNYITYNSTYFDTSINPIDDYNSLTLRLSNLKYLYSIALKRNFRFAVFAGRKDGLLNIQYFDIQPNLVYLNANGKTLNLNITDNKLIDVNNINYQSIFFSIKPIFNVNVYNLSVALYINPYLQYNLKQYKSIGINNTGAEKYNVFNKKITFGITGGFQAAF